ncbi:hypothetical protein [Pantoea piersonii]|uniref:hypothetical protein n=1 Tax=Pantoea piersonii TaxID=2364647 RepID=UPI00289AE7DA|nr:hypothetical protein [Pantoea piersonii]
MDNGLVAQPSVRTKLQIALTSPPVGFAVELPDGVEATKYLTILASQISNDLEAMIASVESVYPPSITLGRGEIALTGAVMSERIAKIEQRLEHLTEALATVNAKLDKIIDSSADSKAVNTVILDKFVEYDRKLDKKPSKDEVAKLISQGTTKQVLWIVGILVSLAVAAVKFLPHT